jgi:hypothetical protein
MYVCPAQSHHTFVRPAAHPICIENGAFLHVLSALPLGQKWLKM